MLLHQSRIQKSIHLSCAKSELFHIFNKIAKSKNYNKFSVNIIKIEQIIKTFFQKIKMFIEKEKYCWNSLRKGRLLAFESDIE